jgi:TP901 family phage tail tape measure protein
MAGAFDAGTVNARLVLDLKEWTGNMEKAKQDTTSLANTVEKNKAVIQDMGKAFTAAGAAITLALGSALKKAADYGDMLAKTSQKTGIAVETLSGLKLAADLSGTSIEGMAMALAKMSRTMSDAQQGSKEAQEAIQRLGITVTDGSGKMKSMDDLLGEVADKFQVMPDGVEKSAMAMEIFGRSGVQMIPLLNQGSKGLKDTRAEAEQLGIVMSGPAAKASEAFNDQITRLKAAFMGIAITIAQTLMPIVKGITSIFTSAAVAVRKVFEIFPPLGSAVTVVVGTFGALMAVVGPLMLALPTLLSIKTKIAAILPVINARLGALKLTLGGIIGVFAAVTLAAQATAFAFQKVHEAQDRAMGVIKQTAEQSSKGWKFAQESIKGSTTVAAEDIKKFIARQREAGRSSEEIGAAIERVYRTRISASMKQVAKDSEEMAATVIEIQREVTDKIKELTLGEYDFRIYQAARWRDDIILKAKDSVNAAKITADAQKAYALEVSKIRKEQAQAAADAEIAAFEKSKRAGEKMWKRWEDEAQDAIPSVQQLMFRASEKMVAAQKWVAQQFGITFGQITSQAAPTTEKLKKSFSDTASKINQTIQILQQGFSQFFSGLNEMSQQRFKQETDRMTEEYEEKKKAIEDSLMTEEEKNAALETLDADFAEKKKALEIKQAEANKRSSLMQAVVNTALAVTSALSTKPFFPMGLIAAAAALAAGYIQVRIIQKQTIPAMAEGGLVNRPTTVLAGEAGPEAILPMRELQRMLGTDRKSGGGAKTVNVNISAIDTLGMESYTRRAIIPEIKRALANESLTISPNAVR